MTAPQTDTTTDPQSTIAALQQKLDAAVAREARRDSDYAERAAHQGATVDVLQAMAASSGDPKPVFELIVRRARDLCDAYGVSLAQVVDGSIVVRAYAIADEAARKKHEVSFPRPVAADTAFGRAILARAPVQVADVEADQAHALREATLQGHVRAIAAVPLMREGEAIGSIIITRRQSGEFSQTQIELLQVFASQAVIAITGAETYRTLEKRTAALAQRNSEYGERIDQQSATIDVLKVMAASPGDAQPVFQLIVDRARAFFDADQANLALLDGSMLHLQATSGSSASYPAQFPRLVDATSMMGRAIVARDMVQTPDVRADPDHFRRTTSSEVAVRAIVAVPLLRGGTPVGAIVLGRNIPGEYSATQVELLRTFAEQAVIAISGAETYLALQTRTADLQEALEYQTATSDVLKVISGSGFELEPVFQTVVGTAARLCRADQAVIFRLQDDAFRWAAGTDMVPEYEHRMRTSAISPGTGTLIGRVALQGRPVQILDGWTDPLLSPGVRDTARIGGVHTMLGVPLVRDGMTIGAIGLARRRVEPFTEQQIELVSTFADQAVIAIENARLLTEQREALEQQTATSEVLQVINASPADLTPVFDTMLERAMRLCDAAFGSLLIYNGESLRAASLRSVPEEFASFLRKPIVPEPGTALAQVIDERRIVHWNDARTQDAYLKRAPLAVAGVEGGGVRTLIGVPLVKDGNLLGIVHLYRQEVTPFSDKHVALLQNFAAQAVIAMENARLLTETREALEQQTATAEVLGVINSNPGDLAPVFDAILEKAHGLCGIAMGSLELYDGRRFRAVAVRGLSDTLADMLRQGYPASENPATGPLIDGVRLTHIRDLAETDYAITRSGARETRTLLCVPLRREGTLLGMIASGRKEVRPFSDKEIALLENFAAQAVIAMENARLLTEQREALERQIAMAEVLQVINASPGDLKPVFDAILEKAMRLCGAAIGGIYGYDGQWFHPVALRGVTPSFAAFSAEHPVPSGPNSAPMRVLRTKRPAQIPDLADGSDYTRGMVQLGSIRALLDVPLLKDDALLGFIAIYREAAGVFPEKQIALLENFAAQAVIAMENARLLTEQREALEQQTATAEVLQVINASPRNLAPVFDAVLEKAVRLCASAFGLLATYDGHVMHYVATRGLTPDQAALLADRPLAAGQPTGRVGDGENVVHLLDARDQEAYRSGFGPTRNFTDKVGARTAMWVALRKDNRLLGILTVFRREVRAFADKEIALVQSFAAQAVIAMENARLLDEIRQRQEELRITFENMGDGVALFDETRHLVASNRRFQDMLDVPDDVISARPAFADYIQYLADRGEYGPNPEDHVAHLLALGSQPAAFERTRPNGRIIEVRSNPVPNGGFVVIYSDITKRKRSEDELRAARDAAEEASRTIEAAYRDLKAAQANLIQAEKMASLGQLTAGIAHEIKNPLNFVNNFSDLSIDLLDELHDAVALRRQTEIDELSTTLKGNLQKIAEHGRRADGIVRSMLEHSRGSSGERRIVDLNALIDEALNLAYHGARAQDQSFNITLERDFAAGIAPIELAPQDMTRVFLNLFSNGFYAATRRARIGAEAGFMPTLRVTTRDAGEAVEVRVRDNGIGVPAELKDKLFQPFFTTKPTGEGTGLGLSISYDIIVKQHGGQVTVDSRPNEFTEFVVALPRGFTVNERVNA